MNSQDTEFGYRDNVAVFSTDRVVNEETVPKFENLKETEYVAYKDCIICQKGGMDLAKLSDHMGQYHNIFFCGQEFDDPVSEWILNAATRDATVALIPKPKTR